MVVTHGGGAARGAAVNAVAVVVGGVDGAVVEDAGDAELLGEPVEGPRGRGAEAFADLLGDAKEGKGRGRDHRGAVHVHGRRIQGGVGGGGGDGSRVVVHSSATGGRGGAVGTGSGKVEEATAGGAAGAADALNLGGEERFDGIAEEKGGAAGA
jgi:hypothetical protein